MATYTIELRNILYALSGYTSPNDTLGYENIDRVINSSWDKFFDFDFPVWDGGKEMLCKHILEDYYFREIGFNSVGRFKAAMRQKLRDIMPYYVELYNTTQLKYDALKPTDYVRAFTGNTTDNSEGSVNTSGGGHVQNYGRGYDEASTATPTTSSENDNNSNTTTKNKDVTDIKNSEVVSGKMNSESYAKIIKEERENIINILAMVSDEIGDLFMSIW